MTKIQTVDEIYIVLAVRADTGLGLDADDCARLANMVQHGLRIENSELYKKNRDSFTDELGDRTSPVKGPTSE